MSQLYIIYLMKIDRYLTKYILEDISEKMVFIGGARQVGKTTLAKKMIAEHFKESSYYNWDNQSDRKKIIKSDWHGNSELIILDEIHKYKKWQSLIKGEYDTLKDKYKFLVTGSARLDIYRKGGDSMQGRYHYYRLHPFSLAEIIKNDSYPSIFEELPIGSKSHKDTLLALDKFGGFPEPFIKQNERAFRRWHNERNSRLFQEDIRDLSQIKDIAGMQILSDILPERSSGILSINSLREDIEVSHKAVKNWLNILESFYFCFRVYPYVSKNYRSLKKDAKLYLKDWSEIKDEAKRFENLIASHLLKFVHFMYDYEGYKINLNYLRNVDKKEVDFFVSIDNKPWFSVEVKTNNTSVSNNLLYYKKKLNIPFSYQVLKKNNIDRFIKGVRIVSADRFLACLI
jgi:uncharacterized protein